MVKRLDQAAPIHQRQVEKVQSPRSPMLVIWAIAWWATHRRKPTVVIVAIRRSCLDGNKIQPPRSLCKGFSAAKLIGSSRPRACWELLKLPGVHRSSTVQQHPAVSPAADSRPTRPHQHLPLIRPLFGRYPTQPQQAPGHEQWTSEPSPADRFVVHPPCEIPNALGRRASHPTGGRSVPADCPGHRGGVPFQGEQARSKRVRAVGQGPPASALGSGVGLDRPSQASSSSKQVPVKRCRDAVARAGLSAFGCGLKQVSSQGNGTRSKVGHSGLSRKRSAEQIKLMDNWRPTAKAGSAELAG